MYSKEDSMIAKWLAPQSRFDAEVCQNGWLRGFIYSGRRCAIAK